MAKERIGFIGVGLMGHGMAKNILLKGHPLTVMAHRNRAPVQDLVEQGASEAATPADVAAASDIVFLCVSTSPVVESVIAGKDGLIEGLKEGGVVVDCSTADPTSTLRMGELLASKGIAFLDAPLGRTPVQAEEGKLNVMVGGDAAVFARVRPVIDCFGENVFHVGALGAGHTIKLINNFFAMTTASAMSEAAAMAAKAGVDLKMLYDVMAAGPLKSGMMDFIMANALEGDSSKLQFALVNARKDVTYYVNMADGLGMPSFIGPATKHLLSLAVAQGKGEDRVPTLCDFIAEIGGAKLRN